MFGFGRPKSRSLARLKGLFAALDVGSSTVTCLVCFADGKNPIRVLGIGSRRADGIEVGNVVNSTLAQQSILNAINQAEEIAGETVERVLLITNAGRPRSRLIELETDIGGTAVTSNHLESLHVYAKKPLDHELDQTATGSRRMFTRAIGYSLDGQSGIVDPTGMIAQSMKTTYVTVSAKHGPIQSIINCVERCHLNVVDVVVGPLASAFGALSDEEREQGTTLVDLGANCTSIAAFHGGNPVHLEVLPAGSDVLTSDLSAALSCSLSDAERIKCLHGAAFLRPTDGSVDISVTSIDPYEAPERVNRAYLVDILQARLDELFDKIAKRLDHPKLLPFTAKRVVLTGGGSGLVGIKDYVALRLGRATRLGRPTSLQGISHMRLQPNHATSIGAVYFAQKNQFKQNLETKNTQVFDPDKSAAHHQNKFPWFRSNIAP